MKDLLKKARERVWLEGDPEKDCSVGLLVAGVIGIILGILAFSAAMLLMVMLSKTGLGVLKPAHLWQVMSLLIFLTGWLITMGLGSIKGRRWARALVLVGAWVTIFFGSLMLALMLYILPEAHGLMMDSGWLTPAAAMKVTYLAVLSLLFLQLVLPMSAIVFYSMRGVEATCRRLNPRPCWTDRIPLPLLAMGFISALGCGSIIAAASINYVVFFFGRIIDGWQGMIVVLLISVACGYIGWGAFRRKTHAWWGAYVVVLAISCSLMLTFSEVDVEALYARMGCTADQIVQLSRYRVLNPAMLTFVSCVWGTMACIYLVWVRDCFQPDTDIKEVKSYEQLMAEREEDREEEPARGPRMRLDD